MHTGFLREGPPYLSAIKMRRRARAGYLALCDVVRRTAPGDSWRRMPPGQLRSGRSRYFRRFAQNLTPRPPGTRGALRTCGRRSAMPGSFPTFTMQCFTVTPTLRGVAMRKFHSRIRWKCRAGIELAIQPPLKRRASPRECFFLPRVCFFYRVYVFCRVYVVLPRECFFSPSKNILFQYHLIEIYDLNCQHPYMNYTSC